MAPPDTRYPSPTRFPFQATAFWAASPGAFFGAPQHKLMPDACIALTASRGCRDLRVRVAMGTALPGIFVSSDPRRLVDLSLCRLQTNTGFALGAGVRRSPFRQ